MATHARPSGPPPLTATEFDALYRRLLSRAAWASEDRGALDALTPDRVVAATQEVRTGRTVTLAAPVETVPGPDNPEPARHRISGQPEEDASGGLHFARDSFAMNVHGDADSHIDALCRVRPVHRPAAAVPLQPGRGHQQGLRPALHPRLEHALQSRGQ
ncbi:hypothetical protein [Streptomyces sp. GbtcB6]|uniref:hypothetical protein n=1 Tax=Streptomyces sp. GbtcB6 TaxID=2824751 RepID=UPI0020C62988|nr:hypothetical protein [Streptomyces sp. GbtcB6]